MKLLREEDSKTTAATGRVARGPRPRHKSAFPVVDLFAGPGGLGEGFASALSERGSALFRSVASIERDEFSHQTLLLRHFLRHFPDGEAPEEYYDFLAKRITIEDLFAAWPAAFAEARRSALRISLGPDWAFDSS